jgi:flagellar protein FliS
MRGLHKYQANRVSSASPQRLLVMLFETAVVRQESALDALQDDDIGQARLDLNRARAIFLELQAGLDPEVDRDLVSRLGSLYSWCTQQLIKAERERDAGAIRESLKITYELLAAWRIAVAEAQLPDLEIK